MFVLLPRNTHRISDAGKRAHAIVRADAAENGAPTGALALRNVTIGDPQASHLLASLPAVIILRGARGPALEGLEVARRMLVFEMQSPSQASAVMVARILDLIFIQILRAWAAGTDAEPNWLAGALDPQIGLALSAIHRDPGHDWTVEELARACNLSRSAFAARFVARSGSRQPPISCTYAWTPPPTCSATPPFRSRSSRRRRLHVGGGIQPRVSKPLRHPTGSLATRRTSETVVSSLGGGTGYERGALCVRGDVLLWVALQASADG